MKDEVFRVTATISAETYKILKKRLSMPPLNKIPKGVLSELFGLFLTTYVNYPELLETCQQFNTQKEEANNLKLKETFFLTDD